jgi:hypothetical protein
MQQHAPSSTRIYVAHDKQPLGCAAQQQQVVLAPTNPLLTPEFQLSVVLISFPLALPVALWAMTSDSTLQLTKTNRLQLTTMLQSKRERSEVSS